MGEEPTASRTVRAVRYIVKEDYVLGGKGVLVTTEKGEVFDHVRSLLERPVAGMEIKIEVEKDER